MKMKDLELEIKKLIIEALELEDITPDDIITNEPLFVDGLGLDSIDALELGVALHRVYGVKIDAEDEMTRENFRSVSSLARFVDNQRSESRISV